MSSESLPPLSPRERWDARYRSSEAQLRDPADTVVRAAAFSAAEHAPGKALDIGCGLGRNALYLASLGWKVDAVDVSPVALERIAHPNIRTYCADLEGGEFAVEPCAYDLTVDVLYLQRGLFPGLRASLRPGGLLALEIPLEDAEAPPMNPHYVLARGELESIFRDWAAVYAEDVKHAPRQRRAAQRIFRKP